MTKFILVAPVLIRWAEQLFSLLFGGSMLSSFATNIVTEEYHKKDSNFDFIKAKKGELVVDIWKNVKKEPTILVCNNTSIAQNLYLDKKFSPLFVSLDFDSHNNWGIRVPNTFEQLNRTIGIKFPT